MSAAVMPSSLYDFTELSLCSIKHDDVSKLGWETGSEGDLKQQVPLSIMTSFLLDNITNQSHRRIERTQSEPAKVPALNGNTSRYKTELCRPYEESGSCKYGEKCQFAHGYHELRCLVRHPKYKTELCRTFHSVGFCPYGPRCHFIHNADEARAGGPPTPVGSSGPVAVPVKSNRPRPLSIDSSSSSSHSSSLGSSPSPPPAYGYANSTPPHSPPSPPSSPESRLPVFNRISAPSTPYNILNMHFGVSELIA